MKATSTDPTAERLAAALLGLFFALFGWFTLWQGGVSLGGKRGGSSFVDGGAASVVAAASLVVAGLGCAMVLRSFKAGSAAYWWSALVLFAPPVAFALWRA